MSRPMPRYDMSLLPLTGPCFFVIIMDVTRLRTLSFCLIGVCSGSNVGSNGFVPYPQYHYFLNDIWYFNFSDGYWTEVEFDVGDPKPDARMDMIFLKTREVLFMHGGYADNYLYDDVWYFDLATHKWLEKERFVYPQYPDSCTDDFEYIYENNCTSLEWPKHLERDRAYPYRILPFSEQDSYYPDSAVGPYWSIFPKHEAPLPGELHYQDTAPKGTPIYPYAASGPLQFVKAFTYSFNYTHNATLYELCTSVWAEPNRLAVRSDTYTYAFLLHGHLHALYSSARDQCNHSICRSLLISLILTCNLLFLTLLHYANAPTCLAAHRRLVRTSQPLSIHSTTSSTKTRCIFYYCLAILWGPHTICSLLIPAAYICQCCLPCAGWDGCRDRVDGNPALPKELQYVKPLARAGK